ncbi:MAG TPA: GspE/PulE family protein, partial [Solirubrobacterales bacterium]|nr:GspE/PulE family protein [Solirubrobacterales bacterium]
DQVEGAVETAHETGIATGRVLYERGVITKDQLAQAIAARSHLVYVDLSVVEIEERALNAIDAASASRYRAVPVQYLDDDTLLVAISEPSNVLAVDDIALMTGLNVQAALTTEEQLESLLARLSRSDATEAARVAQSASSVGAFREARSGDSTASTLLDNLLSNALRQRASDIHIDPDEDGTAHVRLRIDGVTYESMNVAPMLVGRLFARLKIISGMDISVRHLPQDGRAMHRRDGQEVALRVSTLPTIYGESAAIRVLDRSNVPRLEGLGMEDAQLEAVYTALRRSHGAILATGPTGSGKTTTLYAALQALNTSERMIITVEDPVEYPMNRVKQVQVDNKRGLTFAAGLRTLLRSDPDVVMVGEIRDHETAKTAIEAALIGRLVLSTLHTNDAATAVSRLTEMGVERYLVSSAVECVIASRLARKLCVQCKRPVQITESILANAGFLSDESWPFDGFDAVGCERCGGTGYHGRSGLFEVLTFNEEIRELVLERSPSRVISEAARRGGMMSLAEAALERVRRGTISLDEAVRVANAS